MSCRLASRPSASTASSRARSATTASPGRPAISSSRTRAAAPASMRWARATSSGPVSNGTRPISLRYIRTGSALGPGPPREGASTARPRGARFAAGALATTTGAVSAASLTSVGSSGSTVMPWLPSSSVMAPMNSGVGSGEPSATSTSSTVIVPAGWPMLMSRRISSTGTPSSDGGFGTWPVTVRPRVVAGPGNLPTARGPTGGWALRGAPPAAA
jgi:hypothetical protein